MMKKGYSILLIAAFGLVLFGGCGPSEEAIATMTAAAWTPTPEPTLTPTPMPFDLEVTLEGEEGESITYSAYVGATEHEEVMVGDSGTVELLNLPGPEVEVSAAAQGYAPYSETVTLEHGVNTLTLTLAADPAQINPATACDAGQKVLYIEDFEDGFAQGWDGISRPRWAFEDVEGRGKVLTFSEENTDPTGTPLMSEMEVGNIVWKFETFNEGDMYPHVHVTDGKQYTIRFEPGGEGVQLIHQEGPEHKASAYRGYNEFEWINVAIVFYDYSLEFYINNEMYVALDDPDPITTGGLTLHFSPEGGKTGAVSLDNMVVCELSEPYVPPVVEETTE